MKALPLPVRAELRGLPKDLAKEVAAHLLAAQEWLDDDPERALRHANAARRRASRLPVVREAVAEAAYAAEEFSTALTEYRAVQRMTGDPNFWPVIADCERAVGRQDQALRTIRDAHSLELEPTQRVELVLVEAGLRDDMGHRDEAMRLLRDAIGRHEGSHESRARLRYAYANFLEEKGETESAAKWFTAAAGFDSQRELDTRDRLIALGVDVGEEDFDENDDMLIEDDDRPEAEPQDVMDEAGDGDAQPDESGSSGVEDQDAVAHVGGDVAKPGGAEAAEPEAGRGLPEESEIDGVDDQDQGSDVEEVASDKPADGTTDTDPLPEPDSRD